jgi:diguanylate cyclase (GGDEF)-like protein
MLPVGTALIVTAIAVLLFFAWTTTTTDNRALGRQVRMVANVMTEQLEKVGTDQESVTIWDDAVLRTHYDRDIDWTDYNLGRWLNLYFQHDVAVIIDPETGPYYMMEDGELVDPGRYSAYAAILDPMIATLRADIAGGALDAYDYLEDLPAPRVTDYVLIGTRPAIISVVPIISDTGRLEQPRGTESIHVAIRYLDATLADDLGRSLLLEDPRFITGDVAIGDRAALPQISKSGRIVSFVTWEPERPGAALLQHTGWALAAAFAVAALLVVVLLRQLWRASSELEAGRLFAEHTANHDRLTGLPNRNQFDARLAAALAAPSTGKAYLSLLMLDLDRFKQVNDTLGHQAGDDLIRSVGARLRPLLGPDDSLFRLGGDEFAIIHVSPSSARDMLDLSENIIEAIAEPFSFGRSTAHVGVSIGIVTAKTGRREPHELIRMADIALYEAKAAGRNRAMVYQDRMNEVLQLQRTVEGELREALARADQLSVAYQPLVEQTSRTVVGAEALVRWMHPVHGAISPAQFIPVAESSGLIEQLGELVLAEACAMGARLPGRTIAVNISPAQLRNPMFAGSVLRLLHETGMRASDLELEITESILLDDEKMSSQTLRTLRSSGVKIALDDFGTGYSSLSYLKRYPVDRIKIDRSFISQLPEGNVPVAIVQAMISLAHAMRIEVTAEGVETSEQADILGRLGCNTLQGYLFSPAVAAEDFIARFGGDTNLGRRVA